LDNRQEDPLGSGNEVPNGDSLTEAEKKLLISELNLSPDATGDAPNKPQTLSSDDEEKFLDALDSNSVARQIFLKGFRLQAGMATNEEILKEHPQVTDPVQQQQILDQRRIAAGEWTDDEVMEALGG
jgi:hypothetical protein